MWPEGWMITLKQPELSLQKSPFTLRLTYGRLLRSVGPASAAFSSGLRSDTPSTAFFCGYQAAIRFVDPLLEAEQWGALCVSEKGLKSLSSMTTRLDHERGWLSGVKSHALMMGQGMDWLYILAKRGDDIVALKVAANSDGIRIIPNQKPQPFVPDAQHSAIALEAVDVKAAVIFTDAHANINRPFRYWEDVCVGLAFAGWIVRQLIMQESDVSLDFSDAIQKIQSEFSNNTQGYSIDTLQLVDDLYREMMIAGDQIVGDSAVSWKRDRLLLALGEKARQMLREKMAD